MGATMLQRSRLGAGSMLAAGAVLREGIEIPPGHMAAGVPATVKKAARRLLERTGSASRRSTIGSRGQIPSEVCKPIRRLTIALPARAKLNLDLEVLGRDAGRIPRAAHARSRRSRCTTCSTVEPAERNDVDDLRFDVPTATDNSVLERHSALEAAAERELPDAHPPRTSASRPAPAWAAPAPTPPRRCGRSQTMHHLDVDLRPIARAASAPTCRSSSAAGAAHGRGRGERLTPLPDEACVVRDRLARHRAVDRRRVPCLGRGQRARPQPPAPRRGARGRRV